MEQPIFVWVEMAWMIVFSWLVAVVVQQQQKIAARDKTRFPLADTVEGILELMDITLAARVAARHPEGRRLRKDGELDWRARTAAKVRVAGAR